MYTGGRPGYQPPIGGRPPLPPSPRNSGFDDDSFDSDSDDGYENSRTLVDNNTRNQPPPVVRTKLNYTKWLPPADRGARPPMNQQWGGNTHPSNRQPAIPPKEEENAYLPIDQPTSIGEMGRGMMPPNTRPPVHQPFPNRHPKNQQSDRPPMPTPGYQRPPADRAYMTNTCPNRPETDQLDYESVDAPTRPPPDIPTLPKPNKPMHLPPFAQRPTVDHSASGPVKSPVFPPKPSASSKPASPFRQQHAMNNLASALNHPPKPNVDHSASAPVKSPAFPPKPSASSKPASPFRQQHVMNNVANALKLPPKPNVDHSASGPVKSPVFPPKPSSSSKPASPFRQPHAMNNLANALKLPPKPNVDHSASAPVKSPVFPPKPAASSKPASPFRQPHVMNNLASALKLPQKPNDSSLNIRDQRWFQNVDRQQATSSIYREKREGCFIVRPGRDPNRPYSLTVYANQKIYNLQICKRSDSSYAFGSEKPKEASFSNPVDLVNHFMDSSLVLAEGEGEVTLTGPP